MSCLEAFRLALSQFRFRFLRLQVVRNAIYLVSERFGIRRQGGFGAFRNLTVVRLGFLLCRLDQGLQRLLDIEHAEALGHVLGRDWYWYCAHAALPPSMVCGLSPGSDRKSTRLNSSH